jgi:hypothetical protein
MTTAPPSNVIKEAQATIAFGVLNELYRRGHTRVSKDLEPLAVDIYHGIARDKNSVGMIDLFISGEGDFGRLFKEPERSITSKDSSASPRFEINPFLTRVPRQLILDPLKYRNYLERSTMSRKRSALLSGRAILAKAKEVSKKVKIANSYAKLHLVNDDLPSGEDIEDYLQTIVECMVEEEDKEKKEKKAADDKDSDEDDDNDNEEDGAVGNVDDDHGVAATTAAATTAVATKKPLDPTWFFKGFWTFYMYGPYPFGDKGNYVSAHGSVDKKQSRQGAREELAEETKPKAVGRVKVENEASLASLQFEQATIAQKEEDLVRKEQNMRLLGLNSRINLLVARMGQNAGNPATLQALDLELADVDQQIKTILQGIGSHQVSPTVHEFLHQQSSSAPASAVGLEVSVPATVLTSATATTKKRNKQLRKSLKAAASPTRRLSPRKHKAASPTRRLSPRKHKGSSDSTPTAIGTVTQHAIV